MSRLIRQSAVLTCANHKIHSPLSASANGFVKVGFAVGNVGPMTAFGYASRSLQCFGPSFRHPAAPPETICASFPFGPMLLRPTLLLKQPHYRRFRPLLQI